MDYSGDEKYCSIILDPIRTCSNYEPHFGHGLVTEDSSRAFYDIYGNDPFYHWLGLDNDLVYAAHKAAGGITSIYRQIGIGSERLVRSIFMDYLHTNEDQVNWSYSIKNTSGRLQRLSLDARISFNDLEDDVKEIVFDWCSRECQRIGVDSNIANSLKGIVFEVRQGYKSKDSKRQNADLNNASNAYANGYLPCLMVMSSQIDDDIVTRYEASKWVILKGTLLDNDLVSTYSFFKNIIGFDFVSFMERNKESFQNELKNILENLLMLKELK